MPLFGHRQQIAWLAAYMPWTVFLEAFSQDSFIKRDSTSLFPHISDSYNTLCIFLSPSQIRVSPKDDSPCYLPLYTSMWYSSWHLESITWINSIGCYDGAVIKATPALKFWWLVEKEVLFFAHISRMVSRVCFTSCLIWNPMSIFKIWNVAGVMEERKRCWVTSWVLKLLLGERVTFAPHSTAELVRQPSLLQWGEK